MNKRQQKKALLKRTNLNRFWYGMSNRPAVTRIRAQCCICASCDNRKEVIKCLLQDL